MPKKFYGPYLPRAIRQSAFIRSGIFVLKALYTLTGVNSVIGDIWDMENAAKSHKPQESAQAQEQAASGQQASVGGEQPLITKDMTIGEVVARYPETAEIMLGYGLHCIGCHVNPYESIEGGAYGHGMSKEMVEKLIAEMNEAVSGSASAEKKDVNLTQAAASKFTDLMQKEGKAGWGLKFTVEPGGCSGYTYVMDFAEKASENDTVVEDRGLKIFVEKEALSLVKGVKIDYHDGLNGSGFKISNPNSHGSCGCGKSFH